MRDCLIETCIDFRLAWMQTRPSNILSNIENTFNVIVYLCIIYILSFQIQSLENKDLGNTYLGMEEDLKKRT